MIRGRYAREMAEAAERAGMRPESWSSTAAPHVAGRPELSIVIPAFNQADTIADNLREIARRLERTGVDFEMVVV
jgi:hypothetical protein